MLLHVPLIFVAAAKMRR